MKKLLFLSLVFVLSKSAAIEYFFNGVSALLKTDIPEEMKIKLVEMVASIAEQENIKIEKKSNFPKANTNLLFMGNSLSYANFGIENIVKGLLENGYLRGYTVTAQRIGDGGEPIFSYAQRLKSNPNLLDGKNWLILHDQSQVPSFYKYQGDDINDCNSSMQGYPKTFPCSMLGMKEIIALAKGKGVNVMLEATWGYKDGDAHNKDLNPDFLTMNQNLAEAYSRLSWNDKDVLIAPVGQAWERIYLDSKKHGVEPLAPGSLFGRLYTDYHPTPIGSYLFGLVVYASLTGESPEGISWLPSDVVGQLKTGEQNYLKCVAASVVLGHRECAFPK